jgi:protein required for attachment to host cells
MKLKTGEWVVVADGSRGLILVNEGTAMEPQLKVTRTYGQDNPRTSDQGSERPTLTFESGSHRRSAEAMTDLHQRAEDRFVKGMMDDLAKEAAAGSFEHVVIVAPPVALGVMRKAAGKDLAGRVAAWIDKDLTKAPVPEITKSIVTALEA